jgi:glycosyltransferase involved in cell wall biosynthesis
MRTAPRGAVFFGAVTGVAFLPKSPRTQGRRRAYCRDNPARMKKRILYIEGNIDGTVGGSYFVLFDLASRLDRSKFEPIVGFHRDNYLIEQFRANGIQTVLFEPHLPWVPKNPLVRALLAPLRKVVNVWRGVLGPAFRYARWLRKNPVDLINLNNSITRNHSWMLAARWTGTACTSHEMGICTRGEFDALTRFLGPRLDKVVCVSHAVHDNMKACGCDYPNTVVIHNGIDLARYQRRETPDELRRKHGIPADAEVTGVVGHIRYWKGQETIVRATALLKKEFPRIRVLLVGDSSESDRAYREKLETIARELDIVDNLVFTGFQKNAIDYMALMDVVAHTSVDPEPFGIVTLEAMSLAKPLVSTTHGGPAEVVVQGETGLLVDAGKPELLADAIASLLRDRARAAELGRKGLARLHEKFGIEKNVAANAAVYDEVLGSRRAG